LEGSEDLCLRSDTYLDHNPLPGRQLWSVKDRMI